MSKLKTAIRLLKTPGRMVMPLAEMGLFNWIPDSTFLKLIYRAQMGARLDLRNPTTYNEKLQWLKLHDRKPIYHMLVDKYEVKKYVGNMIGIQYTIPTLGIWDNPEDIKIEKLPSQFVLKCTHDSGSVLICRDKRVFDFQGAKRYLKKRMKRSTYWFGREWPYKGVKPRIIAEELLGRGVEPINDYKVLCFHGDPKLVEVHAGRTTAKHTQDFYTTEWKRTEIEQTCKPMAEKPIQMPECLEKMLGFSRVLSNQYIHIRVDWFVENKQLFFGELTFYDGSGFAEFKDEKWDYELGSWMQLPEEQN